MHLNAPSLPTNPHFSRLSILTSLAYLFSLLSPVQQMVREPVPADMVDIMNEKRATLIEAMADLNEEIGDLYLCEEEIPEPLLRKAIRQATIDLKLVPVFMGTAFKNRGVQALLDGVVAYLPCPTDVTNYAMDVNKDEAQVELSGEHSVGFYTHSLSLAVSKYIYLVSSYLSGVLLSSFSLFHTYICMVLIYLWLSTNS
jgi:translation elongation factor EF-G